MSKEALYVVELEKVNNRVLNRAMDLMIKELSLEKVKTANFKIYNNKTLPIQGICVKLPEASYPIDIYVDTNGKLVINGDSMDVKRAAGRIKQFYEGIEFSLKYNSPLKYNKKQDELELLMEVNL